MSDNDRLTLEWLPGAFAVCRFEARAPIPSWALQRAGLSSARSASEQSSDDRHEDVPARFVCVTRTDHELSIVCDESLVPPQAKAERGFAAMRIVGQVDMATIGIFAQLTTALAEARIPVFVLSTFDTDYLMVRSEFARRAAEALSAAGCDFANGVP